MNRRPSSKRVQCRLSSTATRPLKISKSNKRGRTVRKLSWRDDPLNLSDWKIEVTIENGTEIGVGKTHTYPVHRCVLAYGERASEYFFRLFQNGGRFQESDSCTSKIALEPLHAKAFPALLDFIYGATSDKPLWITKEIAHALYYLGEYFDVPSIKEHLVEWLAKHICELDPTASIVTETDLDLWVQIVIRSVPHRQRGRNAQLHLSKVIANVLESHKDEINLPTFLSFIDDAVLHIVDPSVVETLCHIEEKLVAPKGRLSEGDQQKLRSFNKRLTSSLDQSTIN